MVEVATSGAHLEIQASYGFSPLGEYVDGLIRLLNVQSGPYDIRGKTLDNPMRFAQHA